jgi:iron complex outermembrane receptor protein
MSPVLFAQVGTLRGKITDKITNGPLAGANIQVTGKGGTVTDSNGAFSLECSGNMEIVISFVGYETVRQTISDCNSELNLSLTSTSQLLNEVEITATSELNRSILSQPVSITKLGSMEIKRSTGLFLDDAINANVPGVTMQRRTVGAGQQFNIRGYGGGGPGPRGINSNFDQQGIKAYLNGIPITDAEGITLMDDIDFGSVGNVEITKGPSGTLYGLAIAGVVNLQTVRPEKDKTSFGQEVLLGSYGLKRYTTQFQSSTANSSLLVNYGRQSYDGFMEHTASTKKFVNMMGDFRLNDKQNLTTYVGWSNSYDQRNGELTEDQYKTFDYSGNPAYIKNNAHSNVISFRAGIGHTYQLTKDISNTTSVFGTGLNSNVSSAGGWTDKAPINFGLRSVFDMKFKVSNTVQLSGVTGVETQKQYAQIMAYPMVVNNADPTGYNIIGAIRSNQTSTTGTYSLFTQWTLALPKDFSVTAGVGSSSMSIDLKDKLYVAANNTPTNTIPTEYKTDYKNLVSPRIALNKVINRNLSVYASYSQGYRAPVGSNIYTPLAGKVNSDLKPESGKQFEIGTKGSLLDDKLVYELAYFDATFSNKMTLVGVPNATNTATLYSYTINGGTLNNTGIEAIVKYSVISSSDGFVKLLRPFANLTYSDFTYGHFSFQNNITVPPADYKGNAVAGVPKMVYNIGLDFSSNSGLYANATYMHRDKMPFTPDGASVAEGYSLLNAKIGFRKAISTFLELDAYFGANNITSQQYYQMVFVNQLPDAYLPGPKDINYFGGVNLKYIF